MDIYKCSNCGEPATRQTIIEDVYICDDIDCVLTLAEEHFIDNDVDLDIINADKTDDENYFNEE